MEEMEPSAASSIGEIKVIRKEAIDLLWQRVGIALTRYRDGWSADSLDARLIAADETRTLLPPAGWLDHALTRSEPFVDAEGLLAEWP